MSDILCLIIGFALCSTIDHWIVEPVDRHPAAVILWVLTGVALFAISLPLAVGYIAAIAAWVLGDAMSEWREMQDGQ